MSKISTLKRKVFNDVQEFLRNVLTKEHCVEIELKLSQKQE